MQTEVVNSPKASNLVTRLDERFNHTSRNDNLALKLDFGGQGSFTQE